MYVSGHKIEDCREWRRKIQDLIDEQIITVDLLNTKYEINDHFKPHHASHPNPPLYYPTNPFIKGKPGPSNSKAEGPLNKYPYGPENPDQNKPKFEVVFIINEKSVK